jgi:hypothetical protein
MTPQEQLYRWIAAKISRAEGYGVLDAIPTDCRNPGDLELGNRFWVTAVHQGLAFRGSINGITIFPKAEQNCNIEDEKDGWAALYRQVRLILTGKSDEYRPEWTIAQVGTKWTKTDPQAWIQIVSEGLGVDASTPFNMLKPPQAISA